MLACRSGRQGLSAGASAGKVPPKDPSSRASCRPLCSPGPSAWLRERTHGQFFVSAGARLNGGLEKERRGLVGATDAIAGASNHRWSRDLVGK